MIAEAARRLTRLQPSESLHVLNLALAMRNFEGLIAAAAVLEFAVDRWLDFNALRIGLAVELVAAGEIEDAKRVLKVAFRRDPQLRAVVLDHPGLEGVW